MTEALQGVCFVCCYWGCCFVGLFGFLYGLFLKQLKKSSSAQFASCYPKVITQPLSQLPHILNKLIMSTWQLPVVHTCSQEAARISTVNTATVISTTLTSNP